MHSNTSSSVEDEELNHVTHARTHAHSHTWIIVCVCQIPSAKHGMFEHGSLLECLIRPVFEQRVTATYQRMAVAGMSLQWRICWGFLHLSGSHTYASYTKTHWLGERHLKQRETQAHSQQVVAHHTFHLTPAKIPVLIRRLTDLDNSFRYRGIRACVQCCQVLSDHGSLTWVTDPFVCCHVGGGK